jgi:hypothetical protein
MAAKEILSGAVLDLHQRSDTLAQSMSELSDTALRVKDERDAAVKLLRTVLDMRELGAEGPTKSNIRAFLARIGQPVTISRFARQQALEREIARSTRTRSRRSRSCTRSAGALTERYGKDRAKRRPAMHWRGRGGAVRVGEHPRRPSTLPTPPAAA